MSLPTFFDNLALLADAPNGVAKLRELILQLAVEGKLVSQNSSDEPASVLLEGIRKGQVRARRKKQKESASVFSIEDTAHPFDLPSNWEWARLRDISHEWRQKRPDVDFTYIDVAAIDNERGIITDQVKLLEPNDAPSRARKLVKQGTVIYSTVRPYLLNIAIVEKDYSPEPIASTAFAVMHPFDGISARYLFYYLRSRTFIDFVEGQMQGVAYPAINDEKLFSALVPLAPSKEQERIVAKVDELMRLCDEMEARKQARRESRVRLNNATLAPLNDGTSLEPEEFEQASARLADNFATLYDSAETIGKLRSTILQLAVQGKLVPQDPNEESSILLLKAIEEKRKKLVRSSEQKKLDPTRTFDADKLPLSLPQGWDWTQLGEISLKLGAGSTPLGGRSVYREKGVKFLRSQNVWNDGLRLDGVAYISEEIHEDMSGTQVEPGDVLLNITGASIGRSSIVPEDMGEANVSQHVSIIRLVDKRLRFFIHLCVISPYIQGSIMQTQVGISREGLSMRSLKEFVLPIPPLEEQKRIVAKVNQLMALCDELETKLRQAEADSEKLMNAAVQHVLASINGGVNETGSGAVA